MCIYSQVKKSAVKKLCLIYGIITLGATQLFAITSSELEQIIDTSNSLSTAHLVYTGEFNDNRPAAGDEDTFKYKTDTINKYST